MGLFDRTASRLSSHTTLLLPADPGDAFLAAARLYDPEVHRWHDRLVFRNGVLLFGPVAVTPKLEQQAGLPAGMAVAWYTDAAGQSTSQKRPHEAKVEDGDRLVRGLAERLGGTAQYAAPQPNLALIASVYSEQGLAVPQVIEALRPYAGELAAEDASEDSYGLTGKAAPFYVGYFSPRLYSEPNAPPAVGAMRSRPLHHWDLNTGTSVKHAARQLGLTVGEAAFALAGQAGGVVLDVLGFRISRAEELLPR
ncbi:MAG TPA: hypothetical protein VMI33_24020 [Streptosporangiaceae bacterium]|nr:hypothetical protein [Streptosporangiaceae bacterium]